MNIGIIGAGNISDTHVRAALAIPGVRLRAVFAPSLVKASALASRAGALPFDDFERFLSHGPLDLVLIGSPSGRHAEQAIAAAGHGIHALVEKPLDVSVARIDALIAAAERHKVQVGIFFQDRLKPAIARVQQMVAAGGLGRPVLIAGRVKWHRTPEYYGGSRWRGTLALDGGGALINQGIHTVDLMQWMFGPVSSVAAAVATRVHDIEVEDTAAAVLTFASGALGVIEAATSVFPGYARRLELTGSEGTMIIEQDSLVAANLRDGAGPAIDIADGGSSPAATATVSDATPHQRVIEDFIDAVRTGRAPACDAREGRRSVAIVEAVYRSAREGRTVPVDV
jgi:UDP-N-acetyl-2-amino-2-deoxyglucuronate dehydrogenase